MRLHCALTRRRLEQRTERMFLTEDEDERRRKEKQIDARISWRTAAGTEPPGLSSSFF